MEVLLGLVSEHFLDWMLETGVDLAQDGEGGALLVSFADGKGGALLVSWHVQELLNSLYPLIALDHSFSFDLPWSRRT